MKPRSAKLMKCKIDGSVIGVKTGDVEFKGDDLPTDNSEDEGYESGDTGFIGLAFNVTGDLDFSQNQLDIPGIFPRPDLEDVQLTPSRSMATTNPWIMPLARIVSAKNSMPVKSTVGFDFSGRSNGKFTACTGNS